MEEQSETTEIYTRWLEIPAELCPPNHYVLLGVDEFTSDIELIDEAAKKRTSYLHQIASGPGRKEIQRLLGEVAVARRTLLSDDTKTEYDQWLTEPEEEDLAETPAAAPESGSGAFKIDTSADESDSSKSSGTRRAPQKKSGEGRATSTRRKKNTWDVYKYHAISASVLALFVGAFWLFNRGGGPRAAKVPSATAAKSTALSGPGFRKPTSTPPKLGAQKKFTEKQQRKRKAQGTIKNPLDDLTDYDPTPVKQPKAPGPAKASEKSNAKRDGSAAGKKATKNETQKPKPSSSSSKKTPASGAYPAKGKAIQLAKDWDKGLRPLNYFGADYAKHIRVPKNVNNFQMEDGKLVLLSGASNRYGRMAMKRGKFGKENCIAVTTNVKEKTHSGLSIGLELGKSSVRVRANSDSGVTVMAKTPNGKQPAPVGNLPGKLGEVTILLQRDKSDDSLVRWLVTSDGKSLAGKMRASDASKGWVIVTGVPPTEAKYKVHASNLRSGVLKNPIAWPK